MLMSMLIALYTSRAILNAMGVEDFGIYNVVGGIVVMFGVLNSAMSTSTGRYLTFALGSNDMQRLKHVFGMSLMIHVLIAVLVCAIAEPVGIWFIINKMQIPEVRLDAAFFVFHCSVIGAFITIVSVPYNAIIMAHEKMGIFAYFSILDLSLKLLIVFLVQVVDFDRLKAYALLFLAVQVIVQFVYWFYCYGKFKETHVGLYWDKPLFKEMSSFAGWSMFGGSAFLMYTQGINLLLNMFFGASVNAARAIAVQVQGLVIRSVGSFQTALNPQITKSYANNDLAYMHRLIYASSKYSFFVFLIMAMPIFFEAQRILMLWLKVVPEHTVNFVQIMLLISLVNCFSNPLSIAAKATGRIKMFEIVLGSISLTIVPVSYVFLKGGVEPEVVFLVHLLVEIIGQIVRVYMLVPMIHLSVRDYLVKVIFRCCLLFGVSLLIPWLVSNSPIDGAVLKSCVVIVSCVFSVLCMIWMVGLDKMERAMLGAQIGKIWNKVNFFG
jgi:O-antigen/teichoic acid export membrane protein